MSIVLSRADIVKGNGKYSIVAPQRSKVVTPPEPDEPLTDPALLTAIEQVGQALAISHVGQQQAIVEAIKANRQIGQILAVLESDKPSENWTVTITGRDSSGRIETLSFTQGK